MPGVAAYITPPIRPVPLRIGIIFRLAMPKWVVEFDVKGIFVKGDEGALRTTTADHNNRAKQVRV